MTIKFDFLFMLAAVLILCLCFGVVWWEAIVCVLLAKCSAYISWS